MANLKSIPTPTGSNTLPSADAYASLKDSMGRFRTQSLFVEYKHDKYPAPYTLKTYDHRGRMSMYRKYMEIGDPTEYSMAIGLLGSWQHWKVLCQSDWFKPHLKQWREELAVKFESDRYREMLEVAEKQAGTQQGISASRWLAERYEKRTPKRGRPSKAEKKAALIQETEDQRIVKEEALRVGL